jgi:feruloyl esterase
VLQCSGIETDTCLTAAQVIALKKLYGGEQTANGNLFPGYAPGGEAEPAGWRPWITGEAPEHSLMFAFGTQFFKNMVFDDPAWDYQTFSADRDTKTADKRMARILNATNPDLSRFQARRGKLILYHGWSDAAIAPYNTVDYYKAVEKKMGSDDARRFIRLFMVPGLQHCSGGRGPDNFGQGGVASGDSEHNVASALEVWVEQGVAPERIVATKRKNGVGPESAIMRTRPLCAFPLIARYKGSASTDDGANFACAKEQSTHSK